MARSDKLARLIAVFDQFYDALASLADPRAKRLVENWATARPNYIEPKGAPRSAFAAGMEQALREMPMILSSLESADRRLAAGALSAALATHYPDFIAHDAERLNKIKARGFIRGEKEYHLVRHQIDVLEAAPGHAAELKSYYGLVDRYDTSPT